MASEPRPPARVLDITRLVSRAGRVLTGIDRVELAYLRALSAAPEPFFALVRTPFGYLLLAREAAQAFADVLDRGDYGAPGLLSRLSRVSGPVAACHGWLRRHAHARTVRAGLPAMLRRHVPAGTVYVNVGHSTLTDRMFRAWRSVPQARIVVMIHDTIPLDFPQHQKTGTVETFRAKLHRTAQFADLVLTIADVTRADVVRHMALGGRVPPVVVAPLGVEVPRPDADALPAGLPPVAPYFVTVGTIEPRKNHAVLLDAWAMLGPAPPTLLICGSRGWENADVLARLDAGIPGVREVSGLNDAALSALVAGSAGMLFPSVAEGFGLPPLEAAALGVPVVCGALAIYLETMGDCPVYLDVTAPYSWAQEVKRLAIGFETRATVPFQGPTWEAHFNIVLSMA